MRVTELSRYTPKHNFKPQFNYDDDSLQILSNDGEIIFVYTADNNIKAPNASGELKHVGHLYFTLDLRNNVFTRQCTARLEFKDKDGKLIKRSIEVSYKTPNVVHESEYMEAELRLAEEIIEAGIFK